MSEIDTSGGGGKHKGKKRGKKLSTRIDMTPMVDLAFLLVTFFMLATTLSKPSAMPVTMPDPTDIPKEQQNKAAASKALTLILGKDNRIFLYRYFLDKKPEVEETTFGEKNIRKILLDKKAEITADFVPNVKDQSPIILIKPTRDSKYKNMVDILDEMKVTDLKRFVVVDITKADLDYLTQKGLY